jgi:hypothetical protein
MIEIDGEQVPLRDVLRPRRGDEVDLEESGRPDHFLLCHLLSAEFKDLHGPALHAHMRSMGKEFTSRTIPGMASILRDRTSELAEWDPATSLLGEHYLDVLERAETERLAADQARNRSQEGEDPAMGNGPRPALQPGAPGLVTSPGPLVGPKKKEPDLGLSFSP